MWLLCHAGISLTLLTIMLLRSLLFLAALCGAALPLSAADDDYYYYNPVERTSLPDPTVFRADDGYFYLFATENIRNVPVYRSADLINWKYIRTAFTDTSRPTFVDGGNIWAPDINYINGQYVLYYSMSVWGGEWSCGIGVATARRIDGAYQDYGPLFTSEEIGVQNSIDPFYYEDDDGSKYLFWGSFHGIYGIELADDGLSIKEGATKKQIAGTLTEGTCIYKHDGYYYLMGLAGMCCGGANSTYPLFVARPTSLLGPYRDKDGHRAEANYMSDLLYGGDLAIGPGHCSEVLEDDAGQTWLIYHGYPADDPDVGRCLFLDQLQWDSEGWPFIVGEKSSAAWSKPILNGQTFTYSLLDYIDYQGESKNYYYLYDTGYVPTKSTRIELQCHSYDTNAASAAAAGEWRAIYSARGSNADGYSLYVNPNGVEWGYFAGGYINDNMAPHEYNIDYDISASLGELTINGTTYATNRTAYTSTTHRLTLFSGLQDYPYYGRIYSLKVYEDDLLVHDYVPSLRNEDGMPLFYDALTATYVLPSDPFAFSYGSVIDAITPVRGAPAAAKGTYNLAGQRVADTYKGIVVRDGRKVLQ